jgi:hypothetical protein
MPIDIARIVHLTDLHLFVDEHGNTRDPRQLVFDRYFLRIFATLAQKWFAGIENGFNHHSTEALSALLRTLDDLAAEPRNAPLIVTVSGDVEAYGGRPQHSMDFDFPGYDFTDTQLRALKANAFLFVHGNHDVWPGGLPLCHPASANHVLPALQQHPIFGVPIPDAMRVACSGCDVEFYRISTPNPALGPNTLARGKIQAHLPPGHGSYPCSRGADPLAEIDTLIQQRRQQRAVRIAVMHHPPHFFGATGTFVDLREGVLTDAAQFAQHQRKAALPLHLIIAGHRHKSDPARGTILRPQMGGQQQSPLPANLVQLVAPSPTLVDGFAGQRPAFAVYRLELEQDELNVHRTFYRFDCDWDLMFEPDHELLVVEGLRL